MNKRNPESPWNPAEPAQVSPQQYEEQVVNWLRGATENLDSFKIQHLRYLSGSGGDYEFDAVAEITLFKGARIIVLVECKRYSRPVERDEVLALWAKLQDVGAHKAMMFATCGFQSGALSFAKSRGITTITFIKGDFLYETKAAIPTPEPPPCAGLPEFAGIILEKHNDTIHCSTIDHEHIQALQDWLHS